MRILPVRGNSGRGSRRLIFLAVFASGFPMLGQTDPPPPPAPTAASGISSSSAPEPITAKERAKWALEGTFGPASLTGGIISAGWGTLLNRPREYGPHWDGFGDRYGMRLTGIATSNAMEAGLGAIWGEDPRYVRASGENFGGRLGHAVKMAFVAQNKNGRLMPAYARYAAITGNNYLSNTWRADSEATLSRASVRVGIGFLGRIGSNIWDEFWPDVKQGLFHRQANQDGNSFTHSH